MFKSNQPLKIIVDQDIPFVEEYFGKVGEIIKIPGRDLQRQQLVDADMLLVRSITKVDANLLQDTKVRFVGSPTTGIDHFDTVWLDKMGIRWAHAPGSNAIGVAEYVVCVIAALQKNNYLKGDHLRAAVVGVGRIGRLVVKQLTSLGFEVLQCDPVRYENEKHFHHVPLQEITNVDFITLHTPLTKAGLYPTFHMIDKAFLQRQQKNTVLVNTGRGSVIDFNDLKMVGGELIWCLDVYENEPFIDLEVVDQAFIATPHIAGYTLQSKSRSIAMLYEAYLGNKVSVSAPEKKLFIDKATHDWQDRVLQIYNPLKTTALFKQKMIEDYEHGFDALRKNFADSRNEFGYLKQ